MALVVLLFYGKSGTGKNTLLDVIGQAISKMGTRYISIGNIGDDFNEFYLAGAVNVNEAANGRGERRASKEALKEALNEKQKKLLEMIRSEPVITQKKIVEKTGLSRSTVQRIIK